MSASYSVVSYPAALIPQDFVAPVFGKWKRSLRQGNDYYKLIEPKAFFAAYENYISVLLNRPLTVVRYALLSDAPDVIVGWSVIESDILHYVWTHPDCRKQGIATALVPVPINTISHLTYWGLKIWNEKMPEAVFNPFV